MIYSTVASVAMIIGANAYSQTTQVMSGRMSSDFLACYEKVLQCSANRLPADIESYRCARDLLICAKDISRATWVKQIHPEVLPLYNVKLLSDPRVFLLVTCVRYRTDPGSQYTNRDDITAWDLLGVLEHTPYYIKRFLGPFKSNFIIPDFGAYKTDDSELIIFNDLMFSKMQVAHSSATEYTACIENINGLSEAEKRAAIERSKKAYGTVLN